MPGSRRACAIVFLLVVAVILYGSLYPFRFHAHPAATDPFAYLLSEWHDWDHGPDLLANILLYIPFGFFGVRAFGRWAALPIVLGAAALATGVELAQFHDQGRVTSMGDVYADSVGGGVGAMFAVVVGGVRWGLLQELWADPPAALVLLMWFGYRLYPYVPVTNVHKYLRAFAPIVFGPPMVLSDLTRFAIAWTGIGAVLDALYGGRRALILLVLLIGAELLGRVLIIDATLKLADILGAGLAFAMWFLMWQRLGRTKFVLIAAAFAGMIVIARLEPFAFRATPRAFGWVPFVAFMRGSMGVAMQAFCEKFFQYGGLIWLLCRAGARIDFATATTAALLFATSWAETYLPGRTAEITDAAMALVIGGVFALLANRRQGAS